MTIRTVATELPTVRIIYDFVNAAEEAHLMTKVDAVGGETNKLWGWTELNGRRSMQWGGTLTPSSTLIPTPHPPFMDREWPNVLGRIAETGVFDEFGGTGKTRGPNHCLVNEYLPGQGIFHHTDGPAYCPLVATVSLGTHTILTLRPRRSAQLTIDSAPFDAASPPPPPDQALTLPSQASDTVATLPTPSPPPDAGSATLSIFVPARSLLLLSSTLYSEYMHGIEAVKVDDMDSLKACSNWDQWWETTGGGTDLSSLVDGGEGSVEDVEVKKKKVVGSLVARRRMTEASQGWERGRRISLTCRRVAKVRKGIKLG